MGRQKEMMLEHEANVALAAGYLVHVGLLEHCEMHDETYGGMQWDLESDFWRNAMADRNRGDRGPIPWAADIEAREFTDTLRDMRESW